LPHLIISYIKPFCDGIVLSSITFSEQEKQDIAEIWHRTWITDDPDPVSLRLRKHFTLVPFVLQTPDQAEISGTLFRNRETDEKDIPTIIYFQPNGSLYKKGACDWILRKAEKSTTPFNVVAFDYRKTGESDWDGSLSSNGLILDGDAVYQYVTCELGVSEKNVHFYGRSLGGAVSAQVCALHEKTNAYVNSHSFSSLEEVAIDIDTIVSLRLEQIGLELPCFCASLITAILSVIKHVFNWFLYQSGWEFNTVLALEKIRSRKMIIYSQNDHLMQNAALFRSITQNTREEQIISLRLKHNVQVLTPYFNYHNAPYYLFETETGQSVANEILNFLLGEEAISKTRDRSFSPSFEYRVYENKVEKVFL
jgi:hypothetical protein